MYCIDKYFKRSEDQLQRKLKKALVNFLKDIYRRKGTYILIYETKNSESDFTPLYIPKKNVLLLIQRVHPSFSHRVEKINGYVNVMETNIIFFMLNTLFLSYLTAEDGERRLLCLLRRLIEFSRDEENPQIA